MDSYKIKIYKNDKKVMSSETAFPTFVGEDYSIRFITLELLTQIIEDHPSFIDDVYFTLVKMKEKIDKKSV